MWKGLGQARPRKNVQGYEKRRTSGEKEAQLRSCLKKIQLHNRSLLFTLTISITAQDAFQFTVLEEASPVEDLLFVKEKKQSRLQTETAAVAHGVITGASLC